MLDKNYSGYYYDLAISDYLDNAKDVFGKYPTGKYTIEVFMNSGLYDSATFNVY